MNRKELAIKLRKEGYSYSYIKDKTGYSQGTLSYHLAHIPYEPNAETQRRIGKALSAAIQRKAKKKRDSIHNAHADARAHIGKITERDLLMLGIGLYLGEGSKTQDIIRVVNTNPRILRVCMAWFRYLGLSESNFMIRLHVYPDTSIHEAEAYWMKSLGISCAQFQPVTIDHRANKDRKRNGIHPYGTAHLTIRANGNKAFGVTLSRLIGGYMEEVLEYAANKKRA
jgi:hypothetical protein